MVLILVLMVFYCWRLLRESQNLWLNQILLWLQVFNLSLQIPWVYQQFDKLDELRLRIQVLFKLPFQDHLFPRKDGEHHHRPDRILVNYRLHRIEGVVELYCAPKLKYKILEYLPSELPSESGVREKQYSQSLRGLLWSDLRHEQLEVFDKVLLLRKLALFRGKLSPWLLRKVAPTSAIADPLYVRLRVLLFGVYGEISCIILG